MTIPDPRARARKSVAIGLIVAAALLLGCAIWVGVRTLLAVGELEAAVPLASRAQDAILAGDVSAAETSISDLSRHAESAASLTSDPIFAVSEVIPFLGPNLAALRQIAAAIDMSPVTGCHLWLRWGGASTPV